MSDDEKSGDKVCCPGNDRRRKISGGGGFQRRRKGKGANRGTCSPKRGLSLPVQGEGISDGGKGEKKDEGLRKWRKI